MKTFPVRSVCAWLSLFCLSLSVIGCAALFGEDDPAAVQRNRGLGESCNTSSECQTALVCDEGTCQLAGTSAEGAPCLLTGECQANLYCGYPPEATSIQTVCTPAGTSALGESCTMSGDCQAGYYCEYLGFSGTCQEPGSGNVGATCTSTNECLAGLTCGPEETCLPGLPAGGLVWVDPPTCAESDYDATGQFRVLFDVPRSGETTGEFYSLPFPNDIRMRSNHLDMRFHNRPELDSLNNILQTMMSLIEEDVDGFSPHQTVFFRFNAFPRQESLSLDFDDPTLSLVNIDPDSPNYGRLYSLYWSASSGAGKFICHNWLAVRPFWSEPFDSDTVHAAIFTTDVQGPGGEVAVQSEDFAAVIGDSQPSDPDLAAAWTVHAPLRDYLAEQGTNTSTIAAAAVFTTAQPTTHYPGIAQAVEALGAPSISDLVLCDEGVTSPCDDGLADDDHVRGCFSANSDFYEIHTTTTVPVYQDGTRPYLESGGAFSYDAQGLPIQQGTEQVCTSILIPTGMDQPAEGWPVLVYAHGTGGSFQSVVNSLGSAMAETGYAVISYDGVMHGTRRGESTDSPDVLFFNILNPRAAAGNVLQGVVDVMLFGRLAANLSISPTESPTGEAISFNPDALAFMGHSQGGTVAVGALAYDDIYGAAVLSGTGSGLILSILEKTEPIDIAGGIEVVLQDGAPSDAHPVLNLIQMYFEPVDTINVASRLLYQRSEDLDPLHIFMTYGIGDSYTPDRTMQQLSTRAGLPQLTPVLVDYSRPQIDPPVQGNITIGENQITAAVGQYEANGRDAHFVIFDNDTANNQLLRFLETFAAGEVPTIP